MPRVFISHSAKGRAEPVLADLAGALRDGGHEVLLDRSDLKPGVDWRATLNMWMGGCDAAVVLLSEDALTSPHVAYETAILGYRKDMGQGFALVPLVLRPVTYAKVKDSYLGPTMIQRWQSVISDNDPEAAIGQVLVALAAVAPQSAPLDLSASQLGYILRDVPKDRVREHLDDLGVPLPPWIPFDDLAATLATAMLGTGLDTSSDFLRANRTYLRDDIKDAFELLASSWVDFRSIHEIPRAAAAQKAISANTSHPDTARMYVIRSAIETKRLRPCDSWIFADVDAIDADVDELERQVLARLAQRFRVDDGDEVRDEIQIKRDNSEPVFVALPALGLTGAMLCELSERLEGVVFFVLAGSDPPARELRDLALWLTPELEQGAESQFRSIYDRRRNYVLGRSQR